MIRDEIDELMKENGIVVVGEAVYALVQLVIEREREACAKVCEGYNTRQFYNDEDMEVANECAQAIRARGEK